VALSSFNDKIPPYNEEAEEATIGALLLNFSGEILDLVLSFVHPEDFYKPANGNILRAIMRLFDRGAVPDILSVKEELKNHGAAGEIRRYRLSGRTDFIGSHHSQY
jgi:replicative DNA helicase